MIGIRVVATLVTLYCPVVAVSEATAQPTLEILLEDGQDAGEVLPGETVTLEYYLTLPSPGLLNAIVIDLDGHGSAISFGQLEIQRFLGITECFDPACVIVEPDDPHFVWGTFFGSFPDISERRLIATLDVTVSSFDDPRETEFVGFGLGSFIDMQLSDTEFVRYEPQDVELLGLARSGTFLGVPEPATVGLLAAGCGFLSINQRWRLWRAH